MLLGQGCNFDFAQLLAKSSGKVGFFQKFLTLALLLSVAFSRYTILAGEFGNFVIEILPSTFLNQ